MEAIQELNENIRRRVKAATVAIGQPDGQWGGQGVVVFGGYILTAAHCLPWSRGRELWFDDVVTVEFRSRDRVYKSQVLAIEPVADIAILGPLDSPKAIDYYEAWYDGQEPLLICERTWKTFQEFPIWLYTHLGTWIGGRAKFCAEGTAKLSAVTDEQVMGGTSGGPIVDETGALVGLVSVAADQHDDDPEDEPAGMAPFPSLALPRWAVAKIMDAQSRGNEEMT